MVENNNKIKWLHIRLSEAEQKKLKAGRSSSIKRSLSSYARDILLNKPITIYTRSKSLDDFVAEMIALRNELKSIGNNINQAVKKLHVATNHTELKYWSQQILNQRESMEKKTDEINIKIASISDRWLHE